MCTYIYIYIYIYMYVYALFRLACTPSPACSSSPPPCWCRRASWLATVGFQKFMLHMFFQTLGDSNFQRHFEVSNGSWIWGTHFLFCELKLWELTVRRRAVWQLKPKPGGFEMPRHGPRRLPQQGFAYTSISHIYIYIYIYTHARLSISLSLYLYLSLYDIYIYISISLSLYI